MRSVINHSTQPHFKSNSVTSQATHNSWRRCLRWHTLDYICARHARCSGTLSGGQVSPCGYQEDDEPSLLSLLLDVMDL